MFFIKLITKNTLKRLCWSMNCFHMTVSAESSGKFLTAIQTSQFITCGMKSPFYIKPLNVFFNFRLSFQIRCLFISNSSYSYDTKIYGYSNCSSWWILSHKRDKENSLMHFHEDLLCAQANLSYLPTPFHSTGTWNLPLGNDCLLNIQRSDKFIVHFNLSFTTIICATVQHNG